MVWICRAQALALVAGACALLVLLAVSHTSISAAFLAADVVFAILVAGLLSTAVTRSWARGPIFFTELLAVLVSTQVWASGRPFVALAVGVPGVIAVAVVAVSAKPPPRER